MSKNNLEVIKKNAAALKSALMLFSLNEDNDSYESKTPAEREIHNLINALIVKVDKYVYRLENGGQEAPETPEEKLTAKLLGAVNSLTNGNSVVSCEAANQFCSALDLFDIASTAKNAGKTAMAKDKLKGLGG